MEKEKNEIKKQNECLREIDVEITAEDADAEYRRILDDYAARVKMHGFRPGKAPRDMVKKMYVSEIKEAMVNSLVPKALDAEMKKQKITPVTTPMISDLDYKEGGSLRAKAQFEVWPEFELPSYKKIKVDKVENTVSEEDIDRYLEELRGKATQYIPVEDRGVADDDYVMVEIKGQDTKTKRYLPTEKAAVLAGHPENESALNTNLLACRVKDEKSFHVKYPADHAKKRLAGKDINYVIKILSIKEKKIPELTDDFAREISEFNTLQELKDRIRKDMEESRESMARRDLGNRVIEKISEQLNFDLPETVVRQETMAIIQNLLSSQPHANPTREEIAGLEGEAKKKAESNLKNHLILKRIAEKEKIQVTDEDTNEELQKIADANKLPLAGVKDALLKDGRIQEVKDRLLLKKVVDFLTDNAIIG